MMPIGTGCMWVAVSMKPRSRFISPLTAGAHSTAASPPTTIVAEGTRMMSSFVLPATKLPASAPSTAAMKQPSGAPNS